MREGEAVVADNGEYTEYRIERLGATGHVGDYVSFTKSEGPPTELSGDFSFLRELDEEQLRAVLETRGKTVVIAGPGSGKTKVITYKIAYLLLKGLRPSEIVLVTFTRAAAREMIERAQSVARRDLSEMMAGTFHHVCNVLLRRFGSAIGVKPNFTILDEDDARDLIKLVRARYVTNKQLGKALPTPGELYSLLSLANNTLSTPYEVVLRKARRWLNVVDVIERIIAEYELEKGKQNVLDYDDLLLKMLFLLEKKPEIRRAISERFKWVLVDEFQDTNLVQLRIVQYLSEVHGNLFVVADDAQSIYSFRGARFENVNDLLSEAEVYKIQTNYRSTDKIVEFVNVLIPRKSVPKRLRAVRTGTQKPVVVSTYDHFDEAHFVAQRILEHVNEGSNYSDIAVIYRAHSHSLEVQVELAKRNIPFRVLSGLRFTETAHVKDVLAFLKILLNPYDGLSWMRVLRLLENVGETTAERIVSKITSQPSPMDAFFETHVRSGDIESFREVLASSVGKPPAEQIRNFHERFYSDYLRSHYSDFSERREDIERLIEMAEFFATSEDFLNELIISEDVRRIDADDGRGKVTLTTVHQAKGLEWRVVFVIGVNPGDFPHYLALREGNVDEEERLFYVAVTRAKDFLYVTHSIFPRNESRFAERSFLEDIPPHLVEFWRVR